MEVDLTRHAEPSRLRPVAIFITVITALALAVLAAIRIGWTGRFGSMQDERALCRAAYQRARTSADSAMVDLQTPVTSKGHAPFAQSCGLLRRERGA